VHDVRISGFAYLPPTLTVAPGDVIQWTNADRVAHTVTFDNGGYDSGHLPPGARVRLTIARDAKIGRVSYHCHPHPFMHASFTVVRAPVGVQAGGVAVAGRTAAPAPPESEDEDAGAVSANATHFVVEIRGFAFTPKNLTVAEGDVVEWVNRDSAPHTATATAAATATGTAGGVFDTGRIASGGSARWVATGAGEIPYFCRIHPSMTATLVVMPKAAAGGAVTGEDDAGSDGQTTAAPLTANIDVEDFACHPEDVTVRAGGRVKWTNRDSAYHSVSAYDGAWQLGFMPRGGSTERVFDEPGEYEYTCGTHTAMHGRVRVV
jgi:plastocyanin